MSVLFDGQRNERWKVVVGDRGRVWQRDVSDVKTAVLSQRNSIRACNHNYFADEYRVGTVLSWHESVEIA